MIKYSLDTSKNWDGILSLGLEIYVEQKLNLFFPGEQQRIAFCRLFFHQPKYVFLDEATSAVENNIQEKCKIHMSILVTLKILLVYRKLSNLPNCSFITVGHRPEIIQYHKMKLLCLDNQWKVVNTDSKKGSV